MSAFWGGLPLQCFLWVELCLHGTWQRQPTVHCPTFSPSMELELLHCWRGPWRWFQADLHLQLQEFCPEPKKIFWWVFLQISTSFWTTWIVVFKQEAQIYFKGGGRNLTAAEECPPCLWGLRGTETLFHLGACLWSEVSDGWLDYMIYMVSSNFDDSVKFQLLSSDHFEASA